MDSLRIRQYKSSDKEVAWELHRLGLEEIGVQVDPCDGWSQDMHKIEEVYLKGGDFIVGEVEGRVVATAAFKMKDKQTAEFKRFRVHPDFQRRGYGQLMVDEIEKRAKAKGFQKIYLDTTDEWFKAKNLYLKNHYQEVGRRAVAGPDRTVNVVFYEKKLV